MPIQLLPISLANQIAAGEVIERPASVVKELVENCLDAGATEITVDIEQGGRRRIRVRDNGSGIEKAELALALSRHATSKISSLNDLEAIQSLGFRGEALASISSVSRLTLISKPASQTAAWQAWVEGRDMQAKIEPASHPDGSTIDVQDLFFNTPARRKFLRTDKTEFAHIDELLKRIALARFDVRFSLIHNGKMVRQYTAIPSIENYLKRVAQVCGSAFAESALPLQQQSGAVQLWGWVAPPEACRHQGDIQYFYVNGRMMRDRLLGHAVRQAYGSELSDDRSASFVLYLQLPAQEVDVNVHPAKHEVRFQQARQIHDFVLQSVRQVLATATSADKTPAQAATQHGYTASSEALAAQVRELQPRHAQIFPGRSPGATTAPITMPTSAPTAATEQKVVAVVQQRFALLGPEPLALLDLQRVQRAALSKKIQQQAQVGLAGQPLLIPLKFKQPDLLRQFEQQQTQLARLGVRFERTKQALTLLQVPAPLRQTDLNQSLPQLLQRLCNQQDVYAWLATFQVQQHYSQIQAEHWWAVWQQEFASHSDWLLQLTLPKLPEPL